MLTTQAKLILVYGPVHKALILIVYAQNDTLNAHADLSSGVDIHFGLKCHQIPNFVRASSEGSGEAAWMHMLVWANAGFICNKYLNHTLNTHKVLGKPRILSLFLIQ